MLSFSTELFANIFKIMFSFDSAFAPKTPEIVTAPLNGRRISEFDYVL